MSIKRFFKLLLKGTPDQPRSKAPTSLARTAKDAMHVRGGNMQTGGFSSTGAAMDHIEKGHENYEKSFEKDS